MSDLNKTLIKLLFLALSAPLWWPFLKAVWQELNDSLATEGGLFGAKPSPRQAEEIKARQFEAEDPLVNEPLRRPGEDERPSAGMGARRAEAPPTRPERPRFR